MSLFMINQVSTTEPTLQGTYSSKLYQRLATAERKAIFAKRGLEQVMVADVMDVTELAADDFMFCYREIKQEAENLPDDLPHLKTDWQGIQALFLADPRFDDRQ